MKQLCEAYKEFKSTSKELKPQLCCDTITGLYLVTYGFSKVHCEKRGFKVLTVQN